MSSDFRISISSNMINSGYLKTRATVSYEGEDEDLIEYFKENNIDINELATVNITFDDRVSTYKYTVSENRKRIEYKYSGGFLHAFYNRVTQHNLDVVNYPVLSKLKGVSYALLLCCICQALKLDIITPSSNIILEASGGVEGMDEKESTIKLVKNYEKIGFSQIFPQYYNKNLEEEYVPMVGTISDIIKLCTFKNVSKDLLDILPIKLCKDICRS